MIPALDVRGLLPSGIHSGTWQEVEAGFGFNLHRKDLIASAKSFSFNALKPLHPSPLYLAGSTFSDKDLPPDIEATIRIDPTNLTADQALLALQLQLQTTHDDIKKMTKVDFYVTLSVLGAPDFSQFFQYVGEKTALIKGLHEKDKRGVVEVSQWLT